MRVRNNDKEIMCGLSLCPSSLLLADSSLIHTKLLGRGRGLAQNYGSSQTECQCDLLDVLTLILPHIYSLY